jgi:serine/threonine protein kinase
VRRSVKRQALPWRRSPRLPLAEVHLPLAEICGPLAAAHRARVVHRDLKHLNVFL